MLLSREIVVEELAELERVLWWRNAVTYQIYIRSFADANGDGIGDIKGIISRLDYLKRLGIDAIWITPWYPSPQHDNGYDVSDFMAIDPQYGTLGSAQELVEKVHQAGLRIILDIVPNHSSNEHHWFKEALNSDPGSAQRDRYLFRDGKGEEEEEPPNNWQSVFGGPAWTRITERDGQLGQWYCHIFAPEQPDFNWENQEVRDHFIDVLRFWLDRGVDGFRVDVAHGLVKAKGLPDAPFQERLGLLDSRAFPFWDQDEVHEIYRGWRKVLDAYPGERMAVSEAWVNPPSRSALYVRPDELANTFNFDFLTVKWDCNSVVASIDRSIDCMAEVGAPVTWVLNNHDVVRAIDRLNFKQLASENHQSEEKLVLREVSDPERGRQRARAAAMLMLSLPGAAYLYQGEELGLPEVFDIPEDRLQDPIWRMSGMKERGRDGCRVPLPWKGTHQGAFGFSSNESLGPNDSWLPQPVAWGIHSAEEQESDSSSMLSLYRAALKIRRQSPIANGSFFRWLEHSDDYLAFTRDEAHSFICIVTFERSSTIQEGYDILLSSQALDSAEIPPETTVWLQKRN